MLVMMSMRMLALPVLMRCQPLSDLPFSFVKEMGSSFGMRVVLYLKGELVKEIFVRGSVCRS